MHTAVVYKFNPVARCTMRTAGQAHDGGTVDSTTRVYFEPMLNARYAQPASHIQPLVDVQVSVECPVYVQSLARRHNVGRLCYAGGRHERHQSICCLLPTAIHLVAVLGELYSTCVDVQPQRAKRYAVVSRASVLAVDIFFECAERHVCVHAAC